MIANTRKVCRRSLTVKILYNIQDVLISFAVDIDLMKDILQNVILTPNT